MSSAETVLARVDRKSGEGAMVGTYREIKATDVLPSYSHRHSACSPREKI